MKFKKYLNEYKISKKEIEKVKKILAKRERINPKHLKYIGFTDVRDLGIGIQMNFNIMDEKHPRYKSTIVYDLMVKEDQFDKIIAKLMDIEKDELLKGSPSDIKRKKRELEKLKRKWKEEDKKR